VLEKALSDTSRPLSIAEDCLKQRERRTGIDLVHDDVERLLSKVQSLILLRSKVQLLMIPSNSECTVLARSGSVFETVRGQY